MSDSELQELSETPDLSERLITQVASTEQPGSPTFSEKNDELAKRLKTEIEEDVPPAQILEELAQGTLGVETNKEVIPEAGKQVLPETPLQKGMAEISSSVDLLYQLTNEEEYPEEKIKEIELLILTQMSILTEGLQDPNILSDSINVLKKISEWGGQIGHRADGIIIENIVNIDRAMSDMSNRLEVTFPMLIRALKNSGDESKYQSFLDSHVGVICEGIMSSDSKEFYKSMARDVLNDSANNEVKNEIIGLLRTNVISENFNMRKDAMEIVVKVNEDRASEQINSELFALMQENIPTLLEMFNQIGSGNIDATSVKWGITRMLKSGTDISKDKILGFIGERLLVEESKDITLDFLEQILTYGGVMEEDILRRLNLVSPQVAEIVTASGLNTIREKIERERDEYIRNNMSESLHRSPYRLMKPYILEISKSMAKDPIEELQSLNLNPDVFLDAWRKSDKDFKFSAENHMQTIRALEAQRPGSVAYLSQEYGIKNFGRYTTEDLVSQFDEREENGPYIVVMLPQSDDNGAFSEMFKGRNNYNRGSDKVPLRYSEAGGKRDVLRYLRNISKKHGKIGTAIFGAHGSDDGRGMQWGYDDFKGENLLTVNDLMGNSVASLAGEKYFQSNPEIVLLSCSSGLEGGFAQKLSEKLHAKVLAPEKRARVINIVDGEERMGVRVMPVFMDSKTKFYIDGENMSHLHYSNQ